jgi:hypothetical protein
MTDQPSTNGKPVPRPLLDTITEFVNAPDWETSRAILGRSPLLLSEQADEAFEGLIQMYLARGEMRIAYHLAIHRDLLRNCKDLGYKRAFELVSTPPADDILQAIVALLEAEDLPATRAALDAHPELLTPEADAAFQALIQAALETDDRPRMESLATHHELLRAVRRIGADAAFEQAAQAPADDEVSLLMTLSVLGHNTISVLTAEPDMLSDWRDHVVLLQADARAHDDGPLLALTTAILRLLKGESIADVSPDLSGPHAAVWEQIEAALASE